MNSAPPTFPRIRFVNLSVAFVLATLLLALPALAVEQTGEISGKVLDEQKKPFPGATVTLRGENLQGERATLTNEGGEFTFRALPPGSYTVKVAAPGFAAIEQDKVIVNIGRTTPVPILLSQSEISETITVEGILPLIDTGRTSTMDNYGPMYLEEVQIGSNGRSYQSVISNSAGTGPGDGANPTVRGSTIGQNVYLVDGVDSTDPVTATFGTNFIYDAIQEIQFQTGGFEAEYGRAAGGVVNVVTKSGGNTFNWSIDGRYRNENFIQSGDHFDPSEFDITRAIGEGTFGGPIIKDKLWFFTAGSYTQSDFAGDGYNSVFSFEGKYYLGKLTWQAAANHKLILQFSGDPATIDNVDAGPLTAKEASTKQTQGSKFYTLQYQGILTPSLILNAQVAYYKSVLDAEPQSGDLETIGFSNYFTGEVTRNALDAQFSNRFRNQLNATLTWNKDDLAGTHTFKFGADLQEVKFDFNQFTPGGEYDEICTPAEGCPGPFTYVTYNVTRAAGPLENKGLIQGYFVQDAWQVVPRVTVNLGLRYDTYAYDDDLGHEVFSSDLIQPRVGVAWDITGDARNVVKAYGGRFGDASLLALPRVVNSHANATDVFLNENLFGDVNGDGTVEDRGFYGTFGGPGGSVFANGGDLAATSVVEYSASYERQLTSRSGISLTGVRRKTYDIIEDTFDQNSGIYIIDNLPGLERNYYGAELRYRAQWKNLFVAASYNWSKSRGNIEYTQSLGTDFDYPNLSINRYGYLSDDTRHAVKVNGFYHLPLDFQIGVGYYWVNGYPYTITEPTVPYGDIFVEPRGSNRLPRQHQLDLDLRKKFNLDKGTLEGIISVINVFNTEIPTGVFTQGSLAGNPATFQTPRRIEIGARYAFGQEPRSVDRADE